MDLFKNIPSGRLLLEGDRLMNNPEQSEAFLLEMEKEDKKREDWLMSRGWAKVGEVWESPISSELFELDKAYAVMISDLFRENGWRHITEIEKVGKLAKLQTWARYQSPITKRIYAYLEAEWYAERGFDESDYPLGMSSGTVAINNLIKDLKADEYFVWFHKSPDGPIDGIHGKYAFDFWTQEEIRAYKVDEAAKISRVMIDTCVSVERARYALNRADDNVEKAIKYLKEMC